MFQDIFKLTQNTSDESVHNNQHIKFKRDDINYFLIYNQFDNHEAISITRLAVFQSDNREAINRANMHSNMVYFFDDDGSVGATVSTIIKLYNGKIHELMIKKLNDEIEKLSRKLGL